MTDEEPLTFVRNIREDLSYQNAEWDGLVAYLFAYGTKQSAIPKMRQLDGFADQSNFSGDVHQKAAVFMSKERSKYIQPIDAGMPESSHDWHVPLLGMIGPALGEGQTRARQSQTRPANPDRAGTHAKSKGKTKDWK